MIVLGIDPGPKQSAAVIYDMGTPAKSLLHVRHEAREPKVQAWTLPNEEMLGHLHRASAMRHLPGEPTDLGIEMMRCYGEIVGASVFETCVWIGRFIQKWNGPFSYVYRQDQFRYLLGEPTGTARGLKLALIDKFGGRDVAVGGVKCRKCKGKGWFGAGRPVCEECGGGGYLHQPGPLRGLTEHEYDALAIAVTVVEKLRLKQKGT